MVSARCQGQARPSCYGPQAPNPKRDCSWSASLRSVFAEAHRPFVGVSTDISQAMAEADVRLTSVSKEWTAPPINEPSTRLGYTHYSFIRFHMKQAAYKGHVWKDFARCDASSKVLQRLSEPPKQSKSRPNLNPEWTDLTASFKAQAIEWQPRQSRYVSRHVVVIYVAYPHISFAR